MIDFTNPAATVEFAKAAAETGTPHIIGTTGFTPEDIQEIEASAQKDGDCTCWQHVAWGQPFGKTDPPLRLRWMLILISRSLRRITIKRSMRHLAQPSC